MVGSLKEHLFLMRRLKKKKKIGIPLIIPQMKDKVLRKKMLKTLLML